MAPDAHKMETHTPPRVSEPIAISQVSRGYFVYDVDVIMHLRHEHHICGVLRGSLPLFPQQNVFLGVPLELMPEEARLLVDKGAAKIVNDCHMHVNMLRTLSKEERTAFTRSLMKRGVEMAKDAENLAGRKRQDALQRLQRGKPGSHTSSLPDIGAQKMEETSQRRQDSGEVEGNTLFDVPDVPPEGALDSPASSVALEPYRITPTTSSALIHQPTAVSAVDLPQGAGELVGLKLGRSKGHQNGVGDANEAQSFRRERMAVIL
ncbi:MAG: tRNA-splicing endonuclease subunit [Lichina confinis]|nr:MAG: tRNA-splicing endonuclease subunit [Lichina confinis]